MGLLDDAIREHLDLKRRSGADPNEVERQEREALGPVRRGAQVAEEPPPDQEALEHAGPGAMLYDDESDEAFADAAAPAPEFLDEPHEPFAAGEPHERYVEEAEEPFADGEPHEPFAAGEPHEPLPAGEPHEPLPREPLAGETEEEPFAAREPERSWSHDAQGPFDLEEQTQVHEHPDPALPARPPARSPDPSPAEPRSDDPGQETVEYDVEAAEHGEREDDVLEETPEFLQDTPDHDRLWFEQRPPRDFDFDK